MNWFLKTKNRLLKLELIETSFPIIVSQAFDKLIFNQSPLAQNHLLKFFHKKIFYLTFSKLVKTRMRKKNKSQSRVHNCLTACFSQKCHSLL